MTNPTLKLFIGFWLEQRMCNKNQWGRKESAFLYAYRRMRVLFSTPFNRWCDQIDEIAKQPYTIETGRDSWIGYYNAGYSAEEALSEDMSYG